MTLPHVTTEKLFDAAWYVKQLKIKNQDIPDAENLYEHYVNHGVRSKLSPHPLFSASWYVSQNHSAFELHEDGGDPFKHYLMDRSEKNTGPHPLFNSNYYKSQLAAAGIILGENNPLIHFIEIGSKSNISPHPLFDIDWYIVRNQIQPNSSGEWLDPLSHFLKIGCFSGCSPHPLFELDWYLQQNSEAREALNEGMDPLSHFLIEGFRRLYWPHPLFDTGWYYKNNPHAAEAANSGTDPLTHFLEFDLNRDASTHQLFDAAWYRRMYVSPEGFVQNPLLHYIKIGIQCGHHPCKFGRYDQTKRIVSISKPDLTLSITPLVSIIIVNYNGAGHLADLFQSLNSQTYKNFQIVFVDNSSSDNSVDQVRSFNSNAKIIQLDKNVGFAEANNRGFEKSNGELIVLLNNDTKTDPRWLENLVHTARNYPDCAAITSKVLFWERFTSIVIKSSYFFSASKAALLSNLEYKKILVSYGTENGLSYDASFDGDSYTLILNLPVKTGGANLEFLEFTEDAGVAIASKYKERFINITNNSKALFYEFSEYDHRYANFIINNAGSTEIQWLNPGDIGFGEYDIGQYNEQKVVGLICGCSVMIKRLALEGRNLFIEDFVAYYEDSELSRSLCIRGYDLIYCPSSVVYHRHSSTSVEKSKFWFKHVGRNKVLYEYLFEDKFIRDNTFTKRIHEISHYQNWLDLHSGSLNENERNCYEVGPEVLKELVDLRLQAERGNLVKKNIRVGVYNKFWNTMGGGEAHALGFIAILQTYATIELISTDDFEIDKLEKYFGISLYNTAKRIIDNFNEGVTKDYDLFINSTYMDETPSLARNSYYIVSFPSARPSARFLQSYKFLPNSNYTLAWMKSYWGDVFAYDLVFPSLSDALHPKSGAWEFRKEKVILSVGRFFSSGHSKNQHLIAEAFCKITSTYENFSDWRLVLAGSVNDQEYLDKVQAAIGASSGRVIANATFEELKDLYRDAFIYVHASGLGKDREKDPADFEHFGMTVAEATLHGCIPIVFNAAGPSEIVDLLGFGFKFNDETELVESLITVMNSYDGAFRKLDTVRDISSAAAQFIGTVKNSRAIRDMKYFMANERLREE